MSDKKFIIFSPNQHILQFTLLETVAADVIAKKGITPHVIIPFSCTCDIYKASDDWQKNTSTRCVKCESNKLIRKVTSENWKFSAMSDYGEKGDIEEVDALARSITPENMLAISFHGVEVGKIATHDIFLKYKVDSLFDKNEEAAWNQYINLIKICALNILWIERVINRGEPKGILVVNSNYSINRSVCKKAEQHGISWYSISGGGSLRYTWETMMFTRKSMDKHRIAVCRNWEKSSSYRILDSDEIHQVTDHFDELLMAKNAHAYSAPINAGNIDALIKKTTTYKRVILASLSSPDERLASLYSGLREFPETSEYLFPSQMDWLDFLIDKTRNDPDTALIIRVHPREFPNKREGQLSKNAQKLQEKLVNLPKNIIPNWPSDDISFYELLNRVDLVLTCWSTTLIEASLFGCPIVLPKDPIEYYQPMADYVADNKNSYWEKILEFSTQDWSLARCIKTFRWYWNSQFGCNISLKSSTTRVPRPLEKLHKIPDSIGRFSKLKIFDAVPTLAKGFWGEHRQFSRRNLDVVGSRVIEKALFHGFDPLEDIRLTAELQLDDCVSMTKPRTLELEEQCVKQELQRLYAIISEEYNKKHNQIPSKLAKLIKSF